MADENTALEDKDQEDQVQDEESKTSDENVEDESVEADESKSDEQGDEAEFFENEDEYLAQFNLEGKPKTLDEAMRLSQELASENQRLKTQLSDPTRTAPPPPTPASSDNGQRVFARGSWKKQVEEMITSGRIHADNQVFYRQQADFNDAIMNPMLQQMESALSGLAGYVMKQGEAQRSASWSRFQHKGVGVSRQDLDAIMEREGLFDYDDALLQYAMKSGRADLLSKVAKTAERRGEQRGRTRQLRRGTNLPRGKQRPKGITSIPGKFLNMDGTLNQNELNKLSTDDRIKLTNQFVEFLEKKR